MRAWMGSLWRALLFKTSVYDDLRQRPDAFYQGLLVIVVVALLAGLPSLGIDLADAARTPYAEAEYAGARSDLQRILAGTSSVLARLGVPAGVRSQLLGQVEQGMALGLQARAAVAGLPSPLPRLVGQVLHAIGGWLSRPLAGSSIPLGVAAVGTWLGYGVWVMLAARLLGGRATLHGFFGATALYAVPHLLSVFARVPFVGPALAFAGFAWGLAIYVKGTAVSQELSFERALLAVLLPALLAAFLVILGGSILLGILAVVAL